MAKTLNITLKSLETELSGIISKVQDVAVDVQIHLLHVMEFVCDPVNNGNVSPASNLLKAVQRRNDKGKKMSVIRSDAIEAWLVEYAGVRKYSHDKGFKANMAKITWIQANYDKHYSSASKSKWQEFLPEKEYNRFDLKKAIIDLFKRANEKATEKGPKGELNWTPADLRDKLSELARFAEQGPNMPKDYSVTPVPSANTVTLPDTSNTVEPVGAIAA